MTLTFDALEHLPLASLKANCTARLLLPFQGLTLQIWADNPRILELLKRYYAGLTASASSDSQPVQAVFLVDQKVNIQGGDWTPVKRNKPSPLGLKEAYRDTPEGRWIHKVRTGMVFLQTLDAPLAIGDLTRHFSQVVNFINNQFLNVQQRCGYLLGHASAFTANGQATAIAASSGGGKSTLMLKALESPSARFLSNDRILFKPQPEGCATEVLGVAKHPRVNPGTLISSARLAGLLSAAERERYGQMPTVQLWGIEQKYDVLIPALYGDDKTALSGKLSTLVLLDWSLDSTAPTGLSRVDIEQVPEALEGLRKSPGPFFQSGDGHFPLSRRLPVTFTPANWPA
ncbi:HprK-related kinase B [Halomonas sp. TBZ9]|uniref:HprK-related kinase B n=1 Tax=Vreelandella azerica TaxID=2732867 RepID=A0A7Y3TW30_9GAMM|nr:HprK-related kinase B [Halomonas azerica]NOG31175.1 HprK-related kinase B [Halomonas azerica]